MSLTAAQIRKWMREDHLVEILVEQDYMYQVGAGVSATPTVGTLRFSRFGYVDESTSPPTRYVAGLKDVAEYERGLDASTMRGQYNVSVGSTVLANSDRRFDYMLDLAIDGSDHRVYVGDPAWARSDFIYLYRAKAAKKRATYPIDKPATLTIDLRDPALLLNRSIGGTVTVGGTGPSANEFRALNFGFVHQYKPIPKTTQIFTYNSTGTNASVAAVRSNGVVFTGGGTDYTDNGDGTFTLTVPPTTSEVITCDPLVHASASATAYRLSDAWDYLIGGLGGLTAAGMYAGAGAMFEMHGANDPQVGISIAQKTNLVEIANKLADTGNGFWAFTRLGQLFYSWIRGEALSFFLSGSSGGTAPMTIAAEIGQGDLVGDLTIDHNLPKYASYQALGNVNWTKQSTFSSSLTVAQRQQFERDGYAPVAYNGEEPTSTAYLGATVSWKGGAPQLYNLSLSDSQLVSTLISGPDDTTVIDSGATYPASVDTFLQNWAAARRAENLPEVELVALPVWLDLYYVELGDIINLTYPDANLASGRLHQVYKVRIAPMKKRVDLGVTRRRFLDTPGGSTTTSAVSEILQESGNYLLQETGDGFLLESSSTAGPSPIVPASDPYYASVVFLTYFDTETTSAIPMLGSMTGTFDKSSSTTMLTSSPAKFVKALDVSSGANTVSTSGNVPAFGTGEFTIECWAYPTATGIIHFLYGIGSATVDLLCPSCYFGNTQTVRMYLDGVSDLTFSSSGAFVANAWHHIATTRRVISGTNTMQIWVNGVLKGSSTDNNNYVAGKLFVGRKAHPDGTDGFHGYIDDFRITVGVARYTSNFTPPAASFPYP